MNKACITGRQHDNIHNRKTTKRQPHTKSSSDSVSAKINRHFHVRALSTHIMLNFLTRKPVVSMLPPS